MLTENAASVQYFKSFLSRKQKSVVSESIFTIKKKKKLWSFVTFILRLVIRHSVKPVLNWANVCSPEHTSDTSTNYDSFLN